MRRKKRRLTATLSVALRFHGIPTIVANRTKSNREKMKVVSLIGTTLYLFANAAAEYQGIAVQAPANLSEEVLEWPPSEERVDL